MLALVTMRDDTPAAGVSLIEATDTYGKTGTQPKFGRWIAMGLFVLLLAGVAAYFHTYGQGSELSTPLVSAPVPAPAVDSAKGDGFATPMPAPPEAEGNEDTSEDEGPDGTKEAIPTKVMDVLGAAPEKQSSPKNRAKMQEWLRSKQGAVTKGAASKVFQSGLRDLPSEMSGTKGPAAALDVPITSSAPALSVGDKTSEETAAARDPPTGSTEEAPTAPIAFAPSADGKRSEEAAAARDPPNASPIAITPSADGNAAGLGGLTQT